MKKLLAIIALLLPGIVWGQTYNQFKPANGILKGATTTYVTTAAAIADILALASGTCNTSTFLLGSGSCNNTLAATEPRLLLNATGQIADSKLWDWDVTGLVACLRTRTDADGAGNNAICFTRTGTAITSIDFSTAVGVNIAGLTSTGSVNATRFNVTGSTVATNGIYLPSASTLGFSTNSLARGSMDTNFKWNTAFISQGTKPTVTGCSNSSTLGGAVAGSYVSGTTGTCTVTITLPTGPTNGYSCFAHDDTTAADYTQSAIVTSVTTLTISGTTVSGDKIVWGCPLGY